MFAIVLEIKPKTIFLINIKSEKTSYLYAPETDAKKGDVLDVDIKSTNFSKGNTFFKGEYEKLNDGENKFENCLKCENTLKKNQNPLCYSCWKNLFGKNDNKTDKGNKKKNYKSINNADLSYGDISDIEKEIKFISNNINIIREFLVDFSYGKVKSAFNKIKNRINTENKRMQLNSALDNLQSTLPEYYNYPEIKGLFFEMAFYRMIEEMNSTKFGMMGIEPNYKNKFNKLGKKDYESDGEIKFKLAGLDEEVYGLYDCKAYSKGYNIKYHLEKMLNYISRKIDDPREEKTYKYFLVVSGKFTGNPEYHISKITDKDKKNIRFILMTSKQFEKLYNQQADNIWRNKLFYDEFRWEDILEPQNAKPIEVVSDKKINELINDARKNAG